MNRSELLENFRQGFEKIRLALQNFPKHVFDYKPAPDKWSIREIIIHLADSEANAYCRFRKIIAEPGDSVMVYDQDIWAKKLNYNNQEIDPCLELFYHLRVCTYSLLKELPEATWHNFIIHPERGKVTLEDLLAIYAGHVDSHIKQMNKNFDDWKKSKTK